MTEQTVTQVRPSSDVEVEQELDRLWIESERLDKSIEAHQERTRKSRERTLAILSRLRVA